MMDWYDNYTCRSRHAGWCGLRRSLSRLPAVALVTLVWLVLAGPQMAYAEEVSPEAVESLIGLIRAELIRLDEEINKAEIRFVDKFVGKRTSANRGPRTEGSIREDFRALRAKLAEIRTRLPQEQQRWQRKQLSDQELLRRLYRHARRAISLAWRLLRAEASQSVQALAAEQGDIHKEFFKEYEAKDAELQARFGLSTREYQIALKAYIDGLKAREEERKAQMRATYADATQQLLAARRRLGAEAWRWEDIARRRGHDEEAQHCTAFVYRSFAYQLERRPLAEREALLGKDQAAGGSTLDTWRDLRRDRLDIRTFFQWAPVEILRMHQALVAEPVEQLQQLVQDREEAFFEGMRRLRRAETDAGVAAALTDGALTALFIAEEQAATARETLLRFGGPLVGGITDIWIRSEDGRQTYYRAESFSAFQAKLAVLEPQLQAAAARYRRVADAWQRYDDDYQKLVAEREIADAQLQTAAKRAGLSQVALDSANFLVKARRGAFQEGVRDRLTGGWDILETDFAAEALNKANDGELSSPVPQALTEAMQTKNWREPFERELNRFIASTSSPEELTRRLEDLDKVRNWLDTLTVDIDGPSVLDSIRNNFPNPRGTAKEQLDAYFRLEAVQKFELAQLRTSVAFLLRQKAGLLMREAYNIWHGLHSVKSKILENHEASVGLVVTDNEGIPRGKSVEIFIGHDNIERLNVQVELGTKSAEVVGNTVLPKENYNQPARRFRLVAEDLAHDGKGGVNLTIRVVP